MIVNIDKTQLKYVSVGYLTLAEKGETSVIMEESNNKRCITAIFGICLNSSFLPIQSIYAGKTEQSIPHFKFAKQFSLSANPAHYSKLNGIY